MKLRRGIWRAEPAAPAKVLAELRRGAPAPLPDAYFEFLARSDGGEGDFGAEQLGWVSFWPSSEVLILNREYDLQTVLPGFFGFASNGGGELIAFDLRENGASPVVMIPFIPMDARESVLVSPSFDEFRGMLGYECEAG